MKVALHALAELKWAKIERGGSPIISKRFVCLKNVLWVCHYASQASADFLDAQASLAHCVAGAVLTHHGTYTEFYF